jgi:CRISPR-associated protein Cst2
MIKSILITSLVPMNNHIANGGEKLLGNASSIKRRPDGKVYISGQMQRHVLFTAIERLNEDSLDKASTFVSNGDGISNMIENDIRADLGGFMHPSVGDYSGRRTAPLSVTPAVALSESEIGRDLMLRLSTMDRDNAVATREFSEKDIMHMNYSLDITMVGMSKKFTYENGFNIASSYIRHISKKEKLRRIKLFVEATRTMNDYANQARNAVSGEPQKVLIVLDTKLSRKASRYFICNDIEKENIITELKERNAMYFLGDDTIKDSNTVSVAQAYMLAFKELTIEQIYDPIPNNSKEETFASAFGK